MNQSPPTYKKSVQKKCARCKEYLHIDQDEEYMICLGCHECVLLIYSISSEIYSIPSEIKHFSYKRMNYINDLLDQFHLKLSKGIPHTVCDTILMEMKQERCLLNLANLSEEEVKQYLKKQSLPSLDKYFKET